MRGSRGGLALTLVVHGGIRVGHLMESEVTVGRVVALHAAMSLLRAGAAGTRVGE